MRLRDLIHQLRAHIADTLGIESKDAAAGKWWEIDLIIVIFAGAILLGIAAFIQL